jgi:hypothetical protein
MNKIASVFLWFMLVCICPAQSQTDPMMDMYRDMERMDAGERPLSRDSLFKDADKKTNVQSIIHTWQLKKNGALQKKDAILLDTLLDFFNEYHPAFKHTISNTYLGNYGLAVKNNNFFQQQKKSSFYFLQNHEPYMLFPEDLVYYNTTTPFTLLEYSQSERKSTKSESRFNALHTQNVNPFWNIGLLYKQSKSQGQYAYQEANNHFISLFSSYTGNRYWIHANYIFHKIYNQENGGIQNDSDLTEDIDSENIKVNMTEAYSLMRDANLQLTQEYRLGKFMEVKAEDGVFASDTFIPRIGFIHQIEYAGTERTYDEAENYAQNNLYTLVYIDSLYTRDQVKYKRWTNVFQIKAYPLADKKIAFGKRAFIGQDILDMTYPDDFATKENFTNTYIGGSLYKNQGKSLSWSAQAKFYFTGYTKGQTELSGEITNLLRLLNDTTHITIKGTAKTIVPDYFQQRYFSNHYQWDNAFDNVQELSFNAHIHSQRYNFKVGGNYALLNNYVYHSAAVVPAQANKEIMIFSMFLDKDITLKNLFVRNRLLYQYTNGEDYLSLPTFSALVKVTYKFVISKVLKTQVGMNTRYYTAFYADAWDPAIGQFYLQREKKIGDYPYIDAFVNLRLKRTRAFFQLLNVASNWMDKAYFNAPHYPMIGQTFRLGLAWTFYD